MKNVFLGVGVAVGVFAPISSAWTQELIKVAPEKVVAKDNGKMPMSKLLPAKLFPPMGAIKYRVTTSSPECQAYFDQGLNYYYSYVYMEAARSFETALKHDPECAMAYWALSRANQHWARAPFAPPLNKAKELLAKASHRESLLIKAKLAEKGMLDGVTPENRKKEAAKYLDELLTLYDDDEEGWFDRAQIAEGPSAAVPYYKALLRVNPLHAGAHHELVHHYEGIRRPALGWPHAVKYIESAFGIPHAYHMQAHLATRLGKWENSSNWSSKAIELQRAYHKEYNIQPNEDSQYSHHLDILTLTLIHDGRFQEARAIKAHSQAAKYSHAQSWFFLHLAERDWETALKAVELNRKDKVTKSYLRALVFLAMGDMGRAMPEVNVLQEAYQSKRVDKELENRLYEVQGMLLCRQGQSEGGLKLIEKVVARTKNEYKNHAWGHGAYYMEGWGIAALLADRLDIAEEAFLEALAHDAGCVRGALGMQIVCERQGRSEEAARFSELAARCWARADSGQLDKERQALRDLAPATRTVGQASSLP